MTHDLFSLYCSTVHCSLYTLSQIQPFLITHTYTFIVFRAVLPEYALTFILSAVTSLLPHQIVRKLKHTGMHIHTQREDTE